jgi:hypothetical protein
LVEEVVTMFVAKKLVASFGEHSKIVVEPTVGFVGDVDKERKAVVDFGNLDIATTIGVEMVLAKDENNIESVCMAYLELCIVVIAFAS